MYPSHTENLPPPPPKKKKKIESGQPVQTAKGYLDQYFFSYSKPFHRDMVHFYAPISKEGGGGRLFYHCLSIRLSVCLHNLNVKT